MNLFFSELSKNLKKSYLNIEIFEGIDFNMENGLFWDELIIKFQS